MAIPKNKDELLQAIIDNYNKLCLELASIPEIFTELKELDGHAKNTLMSVNNLLAYLIGWGELVLKWNAKKNNGQVVDFPETNYKWNELGNLAQKFYKDYDDDNFETLKTKLQNTTNQILNLVETKTNIELYQTNWYNKFTLGRMIQLNTAAPFKNAKTRIRQYKKLHGLK